MKTRLFLILVSMLFVAPVMMSDCKESSSWTDFCDDVKWVMNSLQSTMKESAISGFNSTVEFVTPDVTLSSINSADVTLISAPALTGLALWRKGFKIQNPVISTKKMFNLQNLSNSIIMERVLTNKLYGLKLGLKNSFKIALASYSTGLAYQVMFEKNDQK